MTRITADDLTYIGSHKPADGIVHRLYAISDELGDAFVGSAAPPHDGIYALIVVRNTGGVLSVRLHVEDQQCPMETVLADGFDYDKANIDESEREAYARAHA